MSTDGCEGTLGENYSGLDFDKCWGCKDDISCKGAFVTTQ